MAQHADQLNIAEYFLTARLDEGLGDRVALRLDHGTRTYAQVDAHANRIGNALAETGVGHECRVIIALPDGEDFAATIFGTLKRGGVAVMVNAGLTTAHLASTLNRARATAVVVDATTAPALLEARAQADTDPPLLVVGETAAADLTLGPRDVTLAQLQVSTELEVVPTHPDDPAVWLFSGGTTGLPKIAVQPHRSLVYAFEAYGRSVVGYRPDDITIAVPKLYFGYATGAALLFPFAVGASTVLFADPPTPSALAWRIARHDVTVLVTVPKLVLAMLNSPDLRPADLHSLRLATSAGEALPPTLHAQWDDRVGVELLDGLGTAEMWHVFCSNHPGAVRQGTLGQAVEGYDVRVRDADGHDLPDGQVGRLWVRGGGRALGYWQNLDETTAAFQGEWFAASDLVQRDADGYFTYVGRDDDALKIGGKWLMPAEVEGCLMEHPAVRTAAVVGAPGGDGLTKPVAFVVLEEAGTVTIEQLQQHVLDRLEPYKHPREVVITGTLPSTHLGKIDRGSLRRQATEALSAAD